MDLKHFNRMDADVDVGVTVIASAELRSGRLNMLKYVGKKLWYMGHSV